MRRFLILGSFLLNVLALYPNINVQAQSLDGSFKTNIARYGISGEVKFFDVQSDNKIIIGGDFSTITGVVCNGLARLNLDGTLDLSFNASAFLSSGDRITDVEIQSDGKVLVAGQFKRWDGVKMVGWGVVRFNSDGALDQDFHPNDLPSPWSTVSMKLQDDGKIVLGWMKENVNAEWQFGLSRLNPDGHIDPNFNCDLLTWQMIRDVAIQPDGKVVVVGGYYRSNPLNLFARFNADGSEDIAFKNGVQVTGGSINVVSVSAAGDLFIGGTFNKCNGIAINGLAKIGSDGLLKMDFIPTFVRTGGVTDIHILSNGMVMVAGDFVYTEPQYSNLIRLNIDGSLNTSFPDFSGNETGKFAIISKIFPDNDGKYLIAGTNLAIDRLTTCTLARINADATVDQSFVIRPGLENAANVTTLAAQPDGKIIVGGHFNYVDNFQRNNIARLNFDGTIDKTFDPGTGANDAILAIYIQPDSKILVTGNFTYFNQKRKMHVVRLNSDGSIDPSFIADGSDYDLFHSIALQNDNKIILKGYKRESDVSQIIRLNINGAADLSFVSPVVKGPSLYALVDDYRRAVMLPIAIQNDGKILTENLRLNIDGSIDLSFKPKDDSFFAALESDNNIIMRGGDYGYTSEPFDGLHRVNPDGSMNKIFDYDFQEHRISALYIQPNKKILVSRESEGEAPGQYFSTALLNANGTIDPTYDGKDLVKTNRLVLLGHAADLVLVAGVSNDFATTTSTALVRFKTSTLSSQSIIFGSILDQTFQNAPLNITLSPSSTSGLPVSLEVVSGNASISGNIVTIYAPGMITVKASQYGDGMFYKATPIVQTFYARQNQDVTFSLIDDTVYSAGIEVNLFASASSGLDVSFEVISGPGSVSGQILKVVGPGKIVVKAYQEGNDAYFPKEATQIFYTRQKQMIDFPEIIPVTYEDEPLTFNLLATATSHLNVTFEVISGFGTIAENSITVSDGGIIMIRARQSGNDEFLAADEVVKSIYVKRNQDISFYEVGEKQWTDEPINIDLNVTTSSGLDVALSLISGDAILTDNKLTVLNAGKIIILASQLGNDLYNAADPVEIIFYAKQQQFITFNAIESVMFSARPILVEAIASSRLPVSLVLISGAAEISGNTLVALEPSAITLRAIQSGDDRFFSAENVDQIFCINPLPPTIKIEGSKLISGGNSNNQWFRNGVLIANATQPTLEIVEQGEYRVRQSVQGCNSELSDGIIITDVEGKKVSDVKIYPNPATHIITIEMGNVAPTEVGITLYDALGKQVFMLDEITNNYPFKNDINVASFPKGVYLLQIVSGLNIWFKKIILN